MKQITIKKDGQVTNQAQFETQEELDSWFSRHQGMGSFGAEAYQSLVSLAIPAQFEEQELLDENGQSFDPPQHESVEIQVEIPAVYETIEAEYTVETSDVTASLAQEATNQVALQYLASTDWMIIRESEGSTACPQAVKDLRAAARLSIIK